MNKLDLTGKVSVVTGASSGIGAAIALTFAQHGSDVAIIDINEEKGSKIAAEMSKKYNRRCIFYNCDVSKYDLVKDTCTRIISEFGKVDNLICGAGYLNSMPANEIKIEVWEKALAVNLSGAFYFIRCLINPMLERAKGNIIIIGSSASINGSGAGIDYAASKTGLHGIIKALSYEMLPRGIRANIITPAVIDTPIFRKRYPDNIKTNKMLNAQMPCGRIGKPQDIANTALFLASDISEYICGQEIIADGGRTLYTHPAGSTTPKSK